MHNDDESVALLHDNLLENEEKKSSQTAQSDSPLPSRLPRWAALCLFALATIDVAVSFYVVRLLLYASPSTLEVRNQYVGLDELYKSGIVNSSHYKPIVNLPRLASQVSSTSPRKIFPEDEHRHLTNFGTLSPPDRHFQVSRIMHTILQFRVMDYGMERCSLALRLPGDSVSSASNGTRLEVCELKAPLPLDSRTLSWNTRPRCLGRPATLVVHPGVFTRLPDFSCSWGSFPTYEVSCAPDSTQCDVDVWSHKGEPYGIFMYQFQTV